MTRNMVEDELLKTKDVLTLVGVSRSTLYKLMEKGIIVPVPLASNVLLQRRRLRFTRGDVEKLLNDSKDVKLE